jgi:hypothetical protein
MTRDRILHDEGAFAPMQKWHISTRHPSSIQKSSKNWAAGWEKLESHVPEKHVTAGTQKTVAELHKC